VSILTAEFLLFFALTAALHWVLPSRFRSLWLFLAGYFFYFTNQPAGLLLLISSTLIDFFLARGIAAQPNPRARKGLLVAGLALNLGILAFFKYANFIGDLFRPLFGWLQVSYPRPLLRLVVPLGLSFYVFKKISYLVDVYRRKLPAERSFPRLALYISFFPALQAGPIDRAGELMAQFPAQRRADSGRLVEGSQLILLGLFKKLVIADRLGILVDTVFRQPESFAGPVVALAAFCYAWQIYCDFSAYTDLARGLGRILGFRLMENFSQPYLAQSIGDFWRRWHISLSTWLRDYLFLPVSYSLLRRFSRRPRLAPRSDRLAYMAAIFVTMLLCGLWHGAGWNFVVWGLLQGAFLVLSFITKKLRRKAVKGLGLSHRPRWRKPLRIAACFSMISFSWIFFRAASIKEALVLVGNLFARPTPPAGIWAGGLFAGLSKLDLIIAGTAVAGLIAAELFLEKRSLHELLAAQPTWRRWLIYYGIIFAVLVFGVYKQPEFIYGRF
jgi:D-alanyl-lipoteichoic acid acyltransferase DltB (MBOAT superfamily)